MTRLTWDEDTRFHEYGLDRGVLYFRPDGDAVVWNGLVSIEENTEPPSLEPIYYDGSVINLNRQPSLFRATVRAYTMPHFLQEATLTRVDGSLTFIDSRKAQPCHMTYRVQTAKGYQIHLLYNCVIIPKTVQHQTIGSDVPVEPFEFELVTLPATYTDTTYPWSGNRYTFASPALLRPPPGADPSAYLDYYKNRYIEDDIFPTLPPWSSDLDLPLYDNFFPGSHFSFDSWDAGNLGPLEDLIWGTPELDASFPSLDTLLGLDLSPIDPPPDPTDEPALWWDFQEALPGFIVWTFDDPPGSTEIVSSGSYLGSDNTYLEDATLMFTAEEYEPGGTGSPPVAGVDGSLYSNESMKWTGYWSFGPQRAFPEWIGPDCEIYLTAHFGSVKGAGDVQGGVILNVGSADAGETTGWLTLISDYGMSLSLQVPGAGFNVSLDSWNHFLGAHQNEFVTMHIVVDRDQLRWEFYTLFGELIYSDETSRSTPNYHTWGDWWWDSPQSLGDPMIFVNGRTGDSDVGDSTSRIENFKLFTRWGSYS